MQDRPSTGEFLAGISTFLDMEVVPALQDPLKFHVRIAANLLRIIDRELHLEPEYLKQELTRLEELLSLPQTSMDLPGKQRDAVLILNKMLSERIKAGNADHGVWRKDVIGHLKQTLIEKLEIANPTMVSKAQEKH